LDQLAALVEETTAMELSNFLVAMVPVALMIPVMSRMPSVMIPRTDLDADLCFCSQGRQGETATQ